MKIKTVPKLSAALVIILALVCLTSAMCQRNDEPYDDSEYSDVTEAEINETNSVPQNRETLAIWLESAYRDAERVFAYFTGYGKIARGETAEIDGATYEKVTEPGLGSRADLEKLCARYFDAELTASLMATRVGDAYLFADYNGVLYRLGGYAGLISYDICEDTRFELIRAMKNGASFTLTCTAELYGQQVTSAQNYSVYYFDCIPVFSEFKLMVQTLEETYENESEGGRFSIGETDGLPGLTLRDLNATDGAHWVPVASYGQNAADYTFAIFVDSLETYVVNFWPGSEGVRYVTLGYMPNKYADGNFTEYCSYRVFTEDGVITSLTRAETLLKSTVSEDGVPFTGSLDGTFTCKSYNNTAGGMLIRFLTVSDNTLSASVSLDGTDASASYSGTFNYDAETGVLYAELEQVVIYENEKGMQRETQNGRIAGKLLDYGGYVHFLCTSSDFGGLSPTDPMPLTFVHPEARSAPALASYMPKEATELLFWHKIFVTEYYLLSYRTEPKSVCVYYTRDAGKTYAKLDIPLPDDIEYDTAEAVFAGGGGGSGEAGIYIELTNGSEVTYLHYYNFGDDYGSLLAFSPVDNRYLAEELLNAYGYNGTPVIFPNTNLPYSADEVSELDALGLPDGDARIKYIKAFLDGNTGTLEELCGVGEGMYDGYKSVEISRFAAYAYTDAYGETGVRFCFYADKSEVETFEKNGWNEFTVNNGINGVYLSPVGIYVGPVSESANALRLMLNSVYFFTIPEDNEMEEHIRWSISEYVCNRLGADEYHTEEEVASYALEFFGIADFTPDRAHISENGCITVPNGGIARFYNLTQTGSGLNTAEYTVQFYADCSKTVKSHAYLYSMKKTDAGWIFTGSTEVYHSEYEPVQLGN